MTRYDIRYHNFLYLFTLAKIRDRELHIMMAHFVAGETMRHIAKDYGVSFERIHQIISMECGKITRFRKSREIILSLKNK